MDKGREAGKGSTIRPKLISTEEEILRLKYAWGEMPGVSPEEFNEMVNAIRNTESGKLRR